SFPQPTRGAGVRTAGVGASAVFRCPPCPRRAAPEAIIRHHARGRPFAPEACWRPRRGEPLGGFSVIVFSKAGRGARLISFDDSAGIQTAGSGTGGGAGLSFARQQEG